MDARGEDDETTIGDNDLRAIDIGAPRGFGIADAGGAAEDGEGAAGDVGPVAVKRDMFCGFEVAEKVHEAVTPCPVRGAVVPGPAWLVVCCGSAVGGCICAALS